MTKEDAARIQSSYAKQHGGEVDKGCFPARAQAVASKHENKSKEFEGGTEQSGSELKSTRYQELKCVWPKRNTDSSSLGEICAHCLVYSGFDNKTTEGKYETNHQNRYNVECAMRVMILTHKL